jgi:cell division protein FtsB
MSEFDEQLVNLNSMIDDLVRRVGQLTEALKEQIAAKHSALNALEAERAAAREEIAGLKAAATWCAKHSVMQPCQHCPDERIVAKLGEETTRRSEMQARLGRAVAALRVTRPWLDARYSPEEAAVVATIDAILADADSKDAGGDALEAERAGHEAEVSRMRETLAATVADLEETLQYAPEYFRGKWDLGQSLPAARAFLRTP